MQSRLILFIALASYSAGNAQVPDAPVGMITGVEGAVELRDPGSNQSRSAEVADLIFAGNQIKTGGTGRVTFLFCPQRVVAQLSPNSQARFTARALETVHGKLKGTRAIPSCRIPILSAATSSQRLGGVNLRGDKTLRLFSPSGTRVLPEGFSMRWSAVDEAESYRLEVRDEAGATIWHSVSTSTSFRYNGPKLRGATEYRWRVTALQGADILASASAWFLVVSTEEEKRIRDTAKGLDSDIKSSQTNHLLMALIYEELEMPDLALAEYEQVSSADANGWLNNRKKLLRTRLSVEQ